MSINTDYTCDRCKKKAEKDKLKSIVVHVVSNPGQHYVSSYEQSKYKQTDWCVSCLVETGLEMSDAKPQPAVIQPPTLEDMIREIVRQEIPQQGN